MYGEGYQPFGDDTGVNGLRVNCRGPGFSGNSIVTLEEYQTFSESYWTPWSGACPAGSAVCSLNTQVEKDEGNMDDAALTDAEMYCCDY